MRIKVFHIVTVLLTVITVWKMNAQTSTFQNLTTRDGLSHNSVNCIFEDSRAYIWFGTDDGLCKYDGYTPIVYKNTADKALFAHIGINTIAEDENQNLWIGTDLGISTFNLNTQKFQQVFVYNGNKKDVPQPMFKKILVDSLNKQIVCISHNAGLYIFDSNLNLTGNYIPPQVFTKNPALFNDGIVVDRLHYVFATSMGLVEFNLSTKKFKRILRGEIHYTNNILKLSENKFLSVQQKGLAIISYHSKDKENSYWLSDLAMPEHSFSAAALNQDGTIWLSSTQLGLGKVKHYNLLETDNTINPDWQEIPNKAQISDIVLSNVSQGWAGTLGNGIYRFRLSELPFHLLNKESDSEHGIHSNTINDLTPLNENRLLISSLEGGQKVFNFFIGEFEASSLVLPVIQYKKPLKIFTDSRQNTWIKYDGNSGLFRIRKGATKLELVSVNNKAIPYYIRINNFAEDKKGNIWMGCNDGVFKITVDSLNRVTAFESTRPNIYTKANGFPIVKTIFIDTLMKCIWAGTQSSGLLRLSFPNGPLLRNANIKRYQHSKEDLHSISANSVSSILRLPNHQLWLGTEGGGICRVIENDRSLTFERFTEKDGLTNNLVKKILPAPNNQLCISTNIGLNLFNTQTKMFQRFSQDDGLPFENFNNFGVAMENGILVFAGKKGLCYFNPNEINPTHKLPKLELSHLKVNNTVVLPDAHSKHRTILQTPLDDCIRLELKHNENIFAIELTSLHFANTKNHKIKYRLEPINKEWIEVSSDKRIIEYNGIRPGEYQFLAQASNSIDEWTPVRHLTIKINPPFWLTPLAFFMYAVLIIVMVYGAMKYVLKLQTLQHNLQLERLEKEKNNEVNLAKLRFFSNISHEIKTPITLLSGPTHLLLNRFRANADVKEKLQIINRQSKKITQLINQVNDFQRADVNLLEFHPTTFNFNDFIKELLIDYEFMAHNDAKRLNTIGDTSFYVKADKEKLEMILNNLLNNAFKFTKANDSIQIEFKVIKQQLRLSISDTGQGISKEDLPYIFDRFFQSKSDDKQKPGSGIGLNFAKRLIEMHAGSIQVRSKLNEGAQFLITLPIVRNMPTDLKVIENEILTQEEHYKHKPFIPKKVDLSMISVDRKLKEALIYAVDDSSDMLQFLEGILSVFFNIKAFQRASECLSAFNQEWPDLVISDVLMPNMNGFELCQHIKSDRKTSHIPVILLTACSTNEDQIQGIENGADDYIRKPFDLKYLVARIVALLKNREALQERFHSNYPLAMKTEDLSKANREFLDSLYTLMSENLDNPEVNIDDFAKKLLLTRTRFYHLVKEYTGKSPYELLKEHRLTRAAELLKQNQFTINEVLSMTGFKSRAHFGRLFKERFNSTPNEYKNTKL